MCSVWSGRLMLEAIVTPLSLFFFYAHRFPFWLSTLEPVDRHQSPIDRRVVRFCVQESRLLFNRPKQK